ncbi:MAG: hypothetical protein ACI4NE_05740 [Succinivibrio sp.]
MKILKIITLSVFMLTLTSVSALESHDKCDGSKVMRVGVAVGGSYGQFQKQFIYIANALKNDGYLNLSQELPSSFIFNDEKQWRNFAENSLGGCIEFSPEGLFVLGWEEQFRKEKKKEIIKEVKNKNKIDLLIAIGSTAGKDFSDDSLGIPVVVTGLMVGTGLSFTDPGEFSTRPNLHVQKQPQRYKTELNLFYDLFKPKVIGVLSDSDPEMYKRHGILELLESAEELGYEVKICKGEIGLPQEYSRCIKELANGSDAVILAGGNGVDIDNFYEQIKPLIDAQIPTMSRINLEMVKRGSLLGVTDASPESSGKFEARVIEQLYHGKNINEISQYYYAPLKLAINLRVANLIEWKPPFEVIIATEDVFREIKR